MTTLYTHNNKLVKINNKFVEKYVAPPPPDEVTIGTQTWKTKNLAIDDGQGGIYTQTVNYGQGDVVEYYYSWDAAVRVAESINGWHLPSLDEWDALVSEVGGSMVAGSILKSTYGWSSGNGTDDYGFSVFPVGRRVSNRFEDFGSYAYFWTSTVMASTSSYGKYFTTAASIASNIQNRSANYCVRLIKDS